MHGSTRFSSSMIASTICAAAAPGAYQAEVPSRLTISPPPVAVRSTSSLMRARGISCSIGTPPTVVAETTGTIWSPWPPSTIAVTSFTEAPVSHAMNAEKRAVSRIPAMPTTRFRLKRDAAFATWHIASSGFETTTRIASRERFDRLTRDLADDRLVRGDEVVARHPGRAGLPGRDHDHVGALGLLVAVRAEDVRLEAEHRAGLVHVERLPLREVGDDVDEDDVRVVAARELEGAGRADVPGADDGDLSTQRRLPACR